MTTHDIHEPVEHDTAGVGAVVAAGLVVLALVVGAAALVAQVVELATWVATP